MNTTIQLATNPFYRISLTERLLNKGYHPQIVEFGKTVEIDSNCVLIIQARLWPEIRCRLSRPTPVVMLGILPRLYSWFEAKYHYPSAFITPWDSSDSIFHSIEQVVQDNHYLSGTVKNILLAGRKNRQERLLGIDLVNHLTQSELEVLVLISQGYTTSEIARQRVRSIHTINTQRKRIRQKLDIVNGERLAVFTGRHVDTFKTLHSIEKEIKMLKKFCKNTI